MTTSRIPEPSNLDTSHAAALADDARAVFAYLARVARAAAEIADEYAGDASWWVDLADDPDDARESAARTRDLADDARDAANAAESYADTGPRGILSSAAEDVDPEALAEVAAEIAQACADALAAVAPRLPEPGDHVRF